MLSIPIKIRVELWQQKTSAAAIARAEGVSRVAVHLTIDGKRKSKRLRRAICKALNLPYSIWEELDREKKAA
jgi:hypothetical protein